MTDIQKRSRIFLDTSALLAGLNSPLGASGVIISLFKAGKIAVAVSPEVIREAERVVLRKFPRLEIPLTDFLASKPIITKPVTALELQRAYRIIHSEDTPILAGALKAKTRVLVTLDKRFERLTKGKVKLDVLSPGEVLRSF